MNTYQDLRGLGTRFKRLSALILAGAKTKYAKGAKVRWNWSGGTATGTISRVYTEPVTLTIEETEVKRNASDENPAYLVVQSNGARALKSHSELEAV